MSFKTTLYNTSEKRVKTNTDIICEAKHSLNNIMHPLNALILIHINSGAMKLLMN